MIWTIVTNIDTWEKKLIKLEEVQLLPPWYEIATREIKKEEYKELGIEVFVEIKIPVQVFLASEDLQKKLLNISLLFSEITRKTRDWFVRVSNINLKDIPEFLSKEEYEQLKSVGVEFSQEVDDLFAEDNEDEENS